jgi:hypothetical protein
MPFRADLDGAAGHLGGGLVVKFASTWLMTVTSRGSASPAYSLTVRRSAAQHQGRMTQRSRTSATGKVQVPGARVLVCGRRRPA